MSTYLDALFSPPVTKTKGKKERGKLIYVLITEAE